MGKVVVSGDTEQEELERFCADAYPQLVGALTHQFGDRWLAEELAQEALVQACDRWTRVRSLASPVGWAFRVGLNLGRSRLRRRGAERRARARCGPDREVARDPDAADRIAVRNALEELSDRQREVVVLRYFLGLTASEVAGLVGSSEGAVRVTTHRAITRLRDVLGEPLPDEEARDVS